MWTNFWCIFCSKNDAWLINQFFVLELKCYFGHAVLNWNLLWFFLKRSGFWLALIVATNITISLEHLSAAQSLATTFQQMSTILNVSKLRDGCQASVISKLIDTSKNKTEQNFRTEWQCFCRDFANNDDKSWNEIIIN